MGGSLAFVSQANSPSGTLEDHLVDFEFQRVQVSLFVTLRVPVPATM